MMELEQPIFGKLTEIAMTVKTFLYGVFLFLDIDTDIVKILAILMAIDTVLGVFKSIRLKRKVSFKKLVWGMVTKTSVLIVPMILALVAKALSFDFSWFVNAVLNILVLSEAFSSITNIISIKEGKELENTDFITKLLHAVRTGLSNLINKLFNIINPQDNK
jgi:toxin secretion/phage lysis holin